MGTISQKLTYLNETKNLLKTQINYGLPTEEQITSSTTFRNYVSSIFNAFLEALRTPDTLFTNLPKKSGSGSVISLNDTANAPMRIELGSVALEQETTTGKNLFLNDRITTATIKNGVTFTPLDDGTFMLNGTATNITYFDVRIENEYPGFNLTQVTNSTKSQTLSGYTLSASVTNGTINVGKNASNGIWSIAVPNSTTFTNAIAKIQLESGSSATSWEPYTGGIASPNPSYPQDIHTISGSNKVEACGKNLFDESNYNHLAMWQGSVGETTTFGESSSYLGAYCKVEAGQTYSVSRQTITNRFVIAVSNTIPSTNSTAVVVARNDSATKIENITIPSGNSYLILYLSNTSGSSDGVNLMVELGSTTPTYTPYVSQEADIDLKSKNLFNPLTFTPKNAMTCTSDGIIRAYTMSSAGWSYSNANIIQTLEAGTYQFTVFFDIKDTNSYPSIRIYDSSDNELALFGNLQNVEKKTMEITLSQKTTIGVMFKISDGQCRFQIEKGSNATDYEEYFEPIEYCKIGNYEDKFIRNSGKNLLNSNFILGSINANGTDDNNTTTRARIDYIEVKPSTTYYFTSSNANLYYVPYFYNESKTFISYLDGWKAQSVSFTTPTNTKYLRIIVKNNSTNTITLSEITEPMISATITEYEPYGSNEWYIKKNIGKVVLDGTQSGLRTPTSNAYRFCIDLGGNAITTTASEISNIISNKFTGISRDNTYSNIQGIAYSDSGKNYKDLIIYCDDTKNMTYAEFKTWLSSNNVIVYYILATPTYTQITGTLAEQLENVYKNMLSQEGQTNISQVNNDLAFNLNVSAIEE